MIHTEEYWKGYSAALDFLKMTVEQDIDSCKYVEDKAKTENDTLKGTFARMQRESQERVLDTINRELEKVGGE